MTSPFKRWATLILAACGICSARSFDVISTNTGGVEIVMVPIHDGTLMLQFKGQAIYVDPDGKGDYSGLPKADLIFFTAKPAGDYSSLRKESTVVVNAPLTGRQTYGEITAEPAGKGLLFSMAGRRLYLSGDAAPAPLERVDAAFVCMSPACAPNPLRTIRSVDARVIFPYRTKGATLQGLKNTPKSEIRLRGWN